MMKRFIVFAVITAMLLMTACGASRNDEKKTEESSISGTLPERPNKETSDASEASAEPVSSSPVSEAEESEESDAPGESSEEISEEKSEEVSKTEKPKYIIVPTEPTSRDTEKEPTSEVSEEDPIRDTSDDPVKPSGNKKIEEALRNIGTITLNETSLVCYTNEVESDGGQTILVFKNNTGNADSVRKTYKFFASGNDYSRAKKNMQYISCDDKNNLLCVSTGTDEPIKNPDDNMYVLIFGYKRY